MATIMSMIRLFPVLLSRCYSLVMLLTFLLVCGGCGGDGIERAQVSGTITLDGTPVPDGQIRFVPIGETKGPSWTVFIRDGRYTTEGSKGTPIGTLRVEIRAYRIHPEFQRRMANSADPEGEGGIPQEQYLPARYNTQSELQMTIDPGSDRITKDFALTSS